MSRKRKPVSQSNVKTELAKETPSIKNPENKEKQIQIPPRESKFQKGYYIATYIIAIIAIAGFVYSIFTSRQTSKTLEILTESLSSFIEPVISYSECDWLYDINYPRGDCDHPPIGLNIGYSNNSNIPLVFLFRQMTFYFGDSLSMWKYIEKKDTTKFFVAMHDKIAYTIRFLPKLRKNMINKLDHFEPPFITIELEAIVSTVSITPEKASCELVNN